MPFPATDDLIAAAEERLGRRFAEAHRARLLRDNGGEVIANGEVWWLFPVWDARNRRTVARTANHIVRENEALRKDLTLPDGYIAIAEDGGGNLLLVEPRGDTVVDWDHETAQLSPVEVEWQPN